MPTIVAHVVKTGGLLAKLAALASKAKAALPYVASAISIGANAASRMNPISQAHVSNMVSYAPQHTPFNLPTPVTISKSPAVPDSQSSRLGQDALAGLEQQREKILGQSLREMMDNSARAANRRGIAGHLGQATQADLPYQAADWQPSVDVYPAQSLASPMANYLNPDNRQYSSIVEDRNWVDGNLAHAQRPITWEERILAHQMQQQSLQQQQALDAQIESARTQTQLAQAQINSTRQAEYASQRPSQLPKAEYKKVDLWKKVEDGDVLTDTEMAQLFHSIDLAYYGSKSPSEHQLVEKAYHYAEDRLAKNMVAHASKTKTGEVIINGVPVLKETALKVAKADIQNYRAADQHLKASKISDLVRQEELMRINQRTNQIINESHNAGDARAIDYFADSTNKSTGANSLDPAKTTNDLSAWHYFVHGLTAEGQDLQTSIQSIPFTTDTDSLRQSFLGIGKYNPDPNSPNPLPAALERWKKTGQDQMVLIPQVVIQTRGLELPDYSIGKVKLHATGIVTRGKNGNPVFKAILEQGDNAEVYTFPKGGRAWYWELPTTFGRSMPFTIFRTIITGRRYIEVELW